MKLYATITSERATKGQGGNKYIDCKLTVGDRNDPTDVYTLHLTNELLVIYHNYEHEMSIHHKGKQKKDKAEIFIDPSGDKHLII